MFFQHKGCFEGKVFEHICMLQSSSSLWQRNMTHTCPEMGSLPCQKFGLGRSYVSSMGPVTWRPTCSSKVFFGKPFTTPLISTVRNTRPNLGFRWLIAKEATRHSSTKLVIEKHYQNSCIAQNCEKCHETYGVDMLPC